MKTVFLALMLALTSCSWLSPNRSITYPNDLVGLWEGQGFGAGNVAFRVVMETTQSDSGKITGIGYLIFGQDSTRCLITGTYQNDLADLTWLAKGFVQPLITFKGILESNNSKLFGIINIRFFFFEVRDQQFTLFRIDRRALIEKQVLRYLDQENQAQKIKNAEMEFYLTPNNQVQQRQQAQKRLNDLANHYKFKNPMQGSNL